MTIKKDDSHLPSSTLIVGQGVAGTLLAFRLWQHNHPFLIVDRDAGQASSAIASGLINPIVVKHFGLTWMAHTLVPEAEKFYRYIESLIFTRFYHPLAIYRIFNQLGQGDLWNRRRLENDADALMGRVTSEVPQGIHAPYGGGWIQGAARVNAEIFMEASRSFFLKNNLIIETAVDVSQLVSVSGGWQYLGKTFGKVIFCQGSQSQSNPWLKDLPVNPLKGQLIRIGSSDFSQDYALSGKVFVLPQGGDFFKVGATWERTMAQGTTSEATNHLLQQAAELIHPSSHHSSMEVIRSYFGFRPTVPDRRPLLGEHPKHKGLYVFNGLGSKGYMLAPWLSLHLYEHIFRHKELIKEVDVKRYLQQ